MYKTGIVLLAVFPLISPAQIIKNEDISMRDYPRNFARMVGMEEDPKLTNNIGSYAVINGVVSCTKHSALSLAKRDRIPKRNWTPFQNYSTAEFTYKDADMSNRPKYKSDLIFEDGSRQDQALLEMCSGHKKVKASVYVLEPPGSEFAPTYDFLKAIKPL